MALGHAAWISCPRWKRSAKGEGRLACRGLSRKRGRGGYIRLTRDAAEALILRGVEALRARFEGRRSGWVGIKTMEKQSPFLDTHHTNKVWSAVW